MDSKFSPIISLADLEPETRSRLDEAERLIREGLEMQTMSVFDVGTQLCEIKPLIGHGHYALWIKSSFRFGIRTAQKYMNVPERLSKHRELLQHFSTSTLYALSAPVADKCRAKVIREIKSETLTTDDDVVARISALLPKPKIDDAIADKREKNLGEAIEMLVAHVGPELPYLSNLLRSSGFGKFANHLDAVIKNSQDLADGSGDSAEPAPMVEAESKVRSEATIDAISPDDAMSEDVNGFKPG